MLSSEIKKNLEKQQYRVVGRHSAVKICAWTKKSIIDEGVCYKEQFYGIKAHQCCQMTPCLYCCNNCVYCWRDISTLNSVNFKEVPDEPKEIIDWCIEEQRGLLNGFPGNPKTNMKKFKEAQNPRFFAISLSGEPTLYPKLDEMIKEHKKRKNCTFLVTNGLYPKHIEKLNNLPTQLYVSLDAPNSQIYKKIDRPMLKDAWERLNKTLELLPSLKTRATLRLTLVKGYNMRNEKEYAELIKKANPLFVETKAYMFVGSSRQRLSLENMPRHNEIMDFAKKICEHSGYKIIDEKANSRVALLMKDDFKGRVMKF